MRLNLKRLAGLLAVAGLVMMGQAQAQDRMENDSAADRVAGDRVESRTDTASGDVTTRADARASASFPAGIQAKPGARESAVEEAVRNVLHTATAAALKGDTNKLFEQLSGPDRERFEDASEIDFNPLRQSVNTLTKAFDEVYGLAANLTDKDLDATRMTVSVGEIADPERLTNWPLDPLGGASQGVAGATASERETRPGMLRTMWRSTARTASSVIDRDYLNKGRDVAIVSLPAAETIPPLTVSMIHEAPDFWKIDIPDNVTADQVQRNLADQINKFAGEAKSWPPDQNETERLLARRVLMALYDIEAGDAAGATSSPGSGAGSSTTPR